MQLGSVHFVIAIVAGWLQREQGAVLAYLKEENNVLREHLGDKRLRSPMRNAVVSLDVARLSAVVAFANLGAS